MTLALDSALHYLPAHLQAELLDGASEADLARCAAHLQAVLRAIRSYLPAYVVSRPRPDSGGTPIYGEFIQGTLMFADISGFTAMSERLSQLGREGAELITGIVNAYFEAMLDIVRRHGGDLFKFGGDAMLVAFLGQDAAANACRAGLDMQRAMGRFASVRTPQGDFSLRATVGLGSGEVFTAGLGAPRRLEFAVMGPALVHMAAAEDAAEPGSVTLDETTRTAAGAAIRAQARPDGFYRLESVETPGDESGLECATNGLTYEATSRRGAPVCAPTIANLVVQLERLSAYLPASLLERLVACPPAVGQADATGVSIEGEHRLATVLFANFYGIDEIIAALGEAHADELTAILNRHFTAMQTVVEKYEGIVNKIDTYAVGYRIMAIFGAPRAHEDDPARAVRAALEMQLAMRDFADLPTSVGRFSLKQRIGVNTGYVFAGNLGSSARQEYTVMGDEVNLSSRLMGMASEGQALVSTSTARHIERLFELRRGPDVRVKGKQAPIANYEVIGLRQRTGGLAGHGQQSPFVGRQVELEQLHDLVEIARGGQGQVIELCGEAGVGKTRLMQEVETYAGVRGLHSLHGEALSYERNVPYLPWLAALRGLFGIEPEPDTAESTAMASDEWKSRALSAALAVASLPDWTPVAAGVLGVAMPDNNLTAGLEARLRRERFFDMALHMLTARAARQPLLIVLDDMQWSDETSLDLLDYLARNLAAIPAILAIVYRPEAGDQAGPQRLADLRDLAYWHTVQLAELNETGRRDLVHAILQYPHAPDDLCEAVVERAQGNPLFLEQVLRVLIETGQGQPHSAGPALDAGASGGAEPASGRLDMSSVPTTLEGLLMSRLDRLEEVNRRILQVAAVIGRAFNIALLGSVYPYGDLGEGLPARLEHLAQHDLVQLARSEPEPEYVFKHTLTQEVAYQSLRFARRRELHGRVGDVIEQRFAGNLGEHYAALARHFNEGQVWDKAFHYAVRAGDKTRDEYANAAALDYYDRALEIAQREALPALQAQTPDIHEAAGDVCTLVGRYPEAIEHYRAAIGAAVSSACRQADLWRKVAKACELQGQFDQALDYLEQGRAALAGAEHCAEMARLYNLMGWVHMRQGNFEQAMAMCSQGVYILADLPKDEIAARDEAELYNTMGTTYNAQGSYQQAAEFYRRSADLREHSGDLLGLARVYTNLGVTYWGRSDYATASQHIQHSLEISQKIGFNYGMAMCYNNLGGISYQAGEYKQAIAYYRQSLALRQRIGDTWGLGQTYINLGEIYNAQKEYTLARQYLGSAIETFTRLEAKGELVEAYWQMAEIELAENNPARALQYAETSLQLALETGNRENQGTIYRIQGQALARSGQAEAAIAALRNSLDALEESENRMELAKSCAELGRLLTQTRQSEQPGDRRPQAIEHLQRAAELFEAMGASREAQQARQSMREVQEAL